MEVVVEQVGVSLQVAEQEIHPLLYQAKEIMAVVILLVILPEPAVVEEVPAQQVPQVRQM